MAKYVLKRKTKEVNTYSINGVDEYVINEEWENVATAVKLLQTEVSNDVSIVMTVIEMLLGANAVEEAKKLDVSEVFELVSELMTITQGGIVDTDNNQFRK